MKTIGMLEFRKNAESILKRAMRGEKLVLSYRGRPVVQLAPYHAGQINRDDPFYQLAGLSEPAGTLSNKEMDRVIYGG